MRSDRCFDLSIAWRVPICLAWSVIAADRVSQRKGLPEGATAACSEAELQYIHAERSVESNWDWPVADERT